MQVTLVPVVILKPVEALVARTPSITRYGMPCAACAPDGMVTIAAEPSEIVTAPAVVLPGTITTASKMTEATGGGRCLNAATVTSAFRGATSQFHKALEYQWVMRINLGE